MSSYLSGVAPGLFEDLLAGNPNRYTGGTYIGVAPESTTVLYKPGDAFGELMAFASLLPIAVCVVLLTTFLCRRTAQSLWLGAGQVANEVLNSLIKIVLKVPRPHSPVINMPEDSYGMPSAHSQYMGYFSTVIIIDCVLSRDMHLYRRAFRIIAVLGMAAVTMFSRYYLHYHTPTQIFAGYACGCIMAFGWCFIAYMLRVLGLMDWALDLQPFRMLLVKDTSYSVTSEYDQWRMNKEKKQN